MHNRHPWIKRTIAAMALAAGASLIGGPDAEAATATGSFDVTAEVFGTCSIATAPLTFPGYTTGQLTAVNGQTDITVVCPGAGASPLSADVEFATVSGSYGMTGPSGDTLTYGLYTDALMSSPFAQGTPESYLVNSDPYLVTVYGQIPGGQSVTAEAGYTQTVNVTLTY